MAKLDSETTACLLIVAAALFLGIEIWEIQKVTVPTAAYPIDMTCDRELKRAQDALEECRNK